MIQCQTIHLLFLITILSSLVGCQQTTPITPNPPVNNTIPTKETSQIAHPYSGIILKGISEDTPASKHIRDVLAPAFQAQTGIQIELEITSYSDMYERSLLDLQQGTGTYDFVYIEQDLIYSYLAQGFLVDLSTLLAENEELTLPDFNPVDFTSFINEFRDPKTQQLYGVPIEAFPKVYIYRKDLFENPELQTSFLAQYNYPLSPAITVQQYQDNAKFFTDYGHANNLDLWGTTVQGAVGHPSSFYEFFETIAPSFGIYNWGIHLDKYKATVANGGSLNSEQAKQALTFWVGLLSYAPPEATQSTWLEVMDAFASGRVAQGWLYGEHMAQLSTNSQVAGKLGVALPPTATGVIEEVLAGQGYLGYYDGGAFGISYASKNKEATLIWLQYLGQSSIQPQWAIASSRIVHLSTFDNPIVQSQNETLNSYYRLMKEQGKLFSGGPPFPFHVEIREVIAPYIDMALTGQLTPEEALDQAAEAVDQALIDLGYGE